MSRIPADKICLIRMSALGDTVHALALVNGLRRGYPNAHLTWILQPLPYELVKHQPNIDRFIIFRKNNGWRAWKELHDQLKREYFDLILIPQVSAKASFAAILTRGRIKLGFDFHRSRELHWLVTNRKLPAHSPQHVQDQYFEFLEYLGIDDYPVEWNFVFTPDELIWREQFFRQFTDPVIAFLVASSNPRKDWNCEGYARVMDHVKRELNLQPVIVGGCSKREQAMVDGILRGSRTNPFVALEKPIRHTLLQLSGSRIVVAPDTGPLHAAVAMKIPTVGLFGYSNPRRCGPYRRYQDLLIDKYTDPGEESSPIRRTTKTGRMDRIMPDEVIEKIELALKPTH